MKLKPEALFPLAVIGALGLALWVARDVSRAPVHIELPRGLVAAPIPQADSGYERPDECRACHEQAWRAWKFSRHSHAATGDLFHVGFGVEPMRWCLTCHSPQEPDPDRALDHGEGVTCAACHNRPGGLATATPPERWGNSPHRLVYDPGLASGKTCSSCHQSDIPISKNINQDTMDEWKRAGGEKLGRCIDCHMPRAPGTSHQFVATRDADFLKRSIPVEARFMENDGATELEIAIGPARTGHMVPTGDPFRELALVWSVSDAGGQVVASGEELLGRRSRTVKDAAGKPHMQEKDERLAVGERKTWRHPVPGAKGKLVAQVSAKIRLMAGEMTKLKGFPGFRTETEFAVVRAER